MFNVGGPEILLVLLVALVVLGPEQLPKAMRTFGNAMAQVRKLSNGFQDEMRSAMNTMDITAAARTTPGSSGSGGVQETAARNDAAPAESGPAPTASTPAPAVDPVQDRPGASPADRAAG
ncbi:MAG: twin-arginine translocase subunit TatB [Acidimicrobiales bacterium]|jgi:sec-independent protein translocase protein TatB|nr:twin-arginine translocase subunit TatB [Acidimicrobiales bacterium]HMS87465.1 Sec-independent protein translocase protein TatB [Acidimicrobiales bacterium]